MGDVISYGKQQISKEDIQAVINVLESPFLTQGPKVKQFEDALCDYTGAKYCVAVSNGTAALHLAVLALNIEEGSEGITTPNTFAASANCMLYGGITPVFADIDSKTYNIDPVKIKSKIGSKTKLLIPVHFAGQVAEMETISKLARQHHLKVIEDAAHAIGSNYEDGSNVGCCKYSDLTTFSFHPVKTITTGEGGAITTNSRELFEKLLLLRNHGITKDGNLILKSPGPWYYEMKALGFNYRLTDIQAALGISQLKRLPDFKEKRRGIANRYNLAFNDVEWLKTPFESASLSSCFHLYVLLIDYKRIGKSRKEIMEHLAAHRIGTQVHYIPVNKLPYYARDNFDECPEMSEYYEKCLSIPLHPSISSDEQEWIIKTIKDLHE
jgi:UDP-4-amino-4,6-dideoxy-N-acetyl-beta-L-altrosamine transaminase